MLLLAAAGAAVLTLLGGGALLVYFVAHPAPARLSLDQKPPAAATPTPGANPAAGQPGCGPAPAGGPAETWLITAGSQAGYRVEEKFAELTSPHEAVARTQAVSGYMLVVRPAGAAPVLAGGCVAVDGRTLRSVDELPPPLPAATRRDGHYGDMLDLFNHPYVVFRAGRATLPDRTLSGDVVKLTLPGELEMRGNVRPIVAGVQARLAGAQAEVAGSVVVHVPDFGVEVPLDPVVSPDVTLEFLLRLAAP